MGKRMVEMIWKPETPDTPTPLHHPLPTILSLLYSNTFLFPRIMRLDRNSVIVLLKAARAEVALHLVDLVTDGQQ